MKSKLNRSFTTAAKALVKEFDTKVEFDTKARRALLQASKAGLLKAARDLNASIRDHNRLVDATDRECTKTINKGNQDLAELSAWNLRVACDRYAMFAIDIEQIK